MVLFAFMFLFGNSAIATDMPECTVNYSEFPKSDLPSTPEHDSLRGCESKKFYYGIGEPVDYVKARKCAFLELQRDTRLVFGDYAILMMIYANGLGVPRDIELAKRIAICHVRGSDAEISGRQSHLNGLAKSKSNKLFDLCNDITSGLMMGFCSSINEERAEAQRKKELDAIVSKWPKSHRDAFQKLNIKANMFFDRRSRDEIDKSGSARGQIVIQDLTEQKNEFKTAVVDFENSRFPTYTDKELKTAETSLNMLYGTIVNMRDSSRAGVSKEDIRKVQRLWLDYRDEWTAFAAIHYPRLAKENLNTWLVIARGKQLKEVIRTLKLLGNTPQEDAEAHP